MAYPDVPVWLEMARLARDMTFSAAQSVLPHPELSAIRRHGLFIGAPRNGHSLIGSLLDAHPDMVIAHELGVPKYLAAHFSRRQIQCLLLANSRRHARQGRSHIHYSHAVPGQWQGRYRELQVLGDKHGEGFLLSVRARPWLIQQAITTLRPACFIHVVRNPHDAIASVVSSSKRGQSVEGAIRYFESLYATLEQVKAQIEPGFLYEFRFEDFLAAPREQLRQLCGFLQVEADVDYLDACASIVLDEVTDHRGLVQWEPDSLGRVAALMARHDCFAGYRLD